MNRFDGKIEEGFSREEGEEILVSKNKNEKNFKSFLIKKNICVLFSICTFVTMFLTFFFLLLKSTNANNFASVLNWIRVGFAISAFISFSINSLSEKEFKLNIQLYCTTAAILSCIL